MKSGRALWRVFIIIITSVVLTGCFPPGSDGLDEEKDPHYLEGLSRMNTRDFGGAAEAFERALQTNPHSASAHKKLGLLYFQQLNEPDTAIYHFRKLLKLRPNDPHADTIKQFVISCQQELARSVSLGPLTKQTQDEITRLTVENDALKKQILGYQNQLVQLTQRVPAPANPVVVQPQLQSPATNAPVARPPPNTQSAPPAERRTQQTATPQRQPVAAASAPERAAKVHKVRSGETFNSIAPKYGISVSTLTAANPSVNPRRLQVGQELKIPSH